VDRLEARATGDGGEAPGPLPPAATDAIRVAVDRLTQLRQRSAEEAGDVVCALAAVLESPLLELSGPTDA